MPGRDLNGKYFKRVTIDCRPDVVLIAVNFDFRLIDGDFLAIPAVRFEEVFELMKPCLIARYDRSTNGLIRRYERPAWYRNTGEVTPLPQRVLTKKILSAGEPSQPCG
jgi:hypothetical protein